MPPADTVAYQTPGRLRQRTVWYAVPCHAGYRSHCAGYDMRPCRAGLSQRVCRIWISCRVRGPAERDRRAAVQRTKPCRMGFRAAQVRLARCMRARVRQRAQPREPGPCRAYRVQVCQQWMSSMTQEERLEVSPLPAQMWAGVSPIPVQIWEWVGPVPLRT